ncbi:TPA: DUF47 family protein [Candidatus Scatousia excrementigallinarum]|uniref:DUF47 family protein n=1 Tax=Candidatus Scatousia excrementigallinarum TaxID=2840935 RepID=A0A9D1F196_9BACT|nr:DUF47 family protein [Candidatus Scatousia excrementigallinarum]
MPKFNLMSYIMPPEDKMFFTLFQDSAEICMNTAKLYDEIMKNHLTEEQKDIARKYKKKGSLSFKLTLKQLNKSFITPIEREDIQYIAVQLHKINKKIIKACLNLDVYRLTEYTGEMKEQALTLVQATEQLGKIIKKFKKVSDVEEITKENIAMKEIESHGDEIHRKAMFDLFSGKYDALEVIKLRDIYKEIENALDACFYVSDTILNVVLKQN